MFDRIIKVATPIIGEEEIRAVAEVLRSGYYVSGPNVKAFEEAWAEYVGVEHAVAVNSGTSALHATLLAFGVGPGDEVIVPALTFFATVSSVLMCGATPVFADIRPDTYCMDCRDAQEKISDKTKAIIPVHLYGHPAEMDKFLQVFWREDGIRIIEDAAQAHGAEYKGRKVGGIGDAGCWSFYATKNLTVATEGGMIATDHADVAEKARIIRNHGMVSRNDHTMLGYNYRMNELAAAIGLCQLKKLDEMNARRDAVSRFILESLRDSGPSWLRPADIPPEHIKPAWFWCPIQVDEDDVGMTTLDLRKLLLSKGIETRHRYNEPLYKQPVLQDYKHLMDYSKVVCPNAEEIAGKMLGLPNHPKVDSIDAKYIVEVLRTI